MLESTNTPAREAFRINGSVMKRKAPGLSCSLQTPENIDSVRLVVLLSSTIRGMTAQQTGGDFTVQRKEFCKRMVAIPTEDDSSAALLMSDEAHLHLSQNVPRESEVRT